MEKASQASVIRKKITDVEFGNEINRLYSPVLDYKEKSVNQTHNLTYYTGTMPNRWALRGLYS